MAQKRRFLTVVLDIARHKVEDDIDEEANVSHEVNPPPDLPHLSSSNQIDATHRAHVQSHAF